jgi:hypothetical protein
MPVFKVLAPGDLAPWFRGRRTLLSTPLLGAI